MRVSPICLQVIVSGDYIPPDTHAVGDANLRNGAAQVGDMEFCFCIVQCDIIYVPAIQVVT
jgi:hypothetical protein